jgi:predicted DNA-binding transcriptional regulator AlpA
VDKNKDVSKSVFGTLRSELDESPDISHEFLALEAGVQAVRLAYMEGKLTAEHAGAILKDLKLIDNTECTWTIGATSTRWYRKIKGGLWEVSGYPENVQLGMDAPAWVSSGVYEIINQFTDKKKDQSEAKASPISLLPKIENVNSDEDRDWLFSEWDTVVKPAESEASLMSNIRNSDLNDVPDSWKSNSSLMDKLSIDNSKVPSDRDHKFTDALDEEESVLTNSEPVEGPNNDFMLPEDYFLKDDDSK